MPLATLSTQVPTGYLVLTGPVQPTPDDYDVTGLYETVAYDWEGRRALSVRSLSSRQALRLHRLAAEWAWDQVPTQRTGSEQ